MSRSRAKAAIPRLVRHKSSSPADFIALTRPFMATTYARPEFVLERGQGSRIWDSQGKEYVDFTAGIAVTALGHSDPGVTKVINEQASTLIHSSNLYYNEWTPRLSRAMIEKTRQSGAMSDAAALFVANSGTEANEAALKFARKAGRLQSPDKVGVLAFSGGFHGRTFGALSATFNPKYQDPFGPMVPGFESATLNDYDSLSLINEQTCAVIVEPIQGEGGVFVANAAWLESLRKKCDDAGATLIYDEIQCGLGRTGSLWAHTEAGPRAQPDIVTMAKALGNGYPIGATMISDKINKALKVGDHGTTFGGGPLASRIGLYVLEQVSSPAILDNVKARSAQIQQQAAAWADKYPHLVRGIRGRGLLLGIQLSKAPDPVILAARDNGLLIVSAGSNTVRLVPALNITQKDTQEGLEKLDRALAAAA